MFQPSPDTSLTTCSHPMPVEAPLRPSPLSSPSNEQAHHMRLVRPCRYDCEQNDLVDEENCGSFDCGLRIADSSCPRIRLLLRRLLRKTVHLLSIRKGQSAIRNP